MQAGSVLVPNLAAMDPQWQLLQQQQGLYYVDQNFMGQQALHGIGGAAGLRQWQQWGGAATLPQQPMRLQMQQRQFVFRQPAGNACDGGSSSSYYGNNTDESMGLQCMAPDGAAAVGWGGQAITETRHSKGRGKGRAGYQGGSGGGGRRNSNDHHSDNRRHNGGGGGRRLDGDSWDERGSLEEVIRMFQAVRVPKAAGGNKRGQLPIIPPLVFEALEAFDGRRLAFLLKEMAKNGMAAQALQLFDSLQAMMGVHPLGQLCDTYSYTAVVSVCIPEQDAQRALCLVNEMKHRGVARSVHTYTALMNVCIKCGKPKLALDAYKAMLEDGLQPNVITFNTLVDVYGKMGSWSEALNVLQVMRAVGVEPVLRTYNTLMIACNICQQAREALQLYDLMKAEGFSPNATTYNTLITAYGKVGQLDRALETFREMRSKGYPRSVVTYSTLISACEKANPCQWRKALELFGEMRPDGCAPNTVTYNSLIKACAQGGQWEKAMELFEAMGGEGCRPDVVTFTALISACDKGGQWRTALTMFERMRSCGCKPDSIVYNAVIDCLWETGVVAAQCQALQLFHRAQKDGYFHQPRLDDLGGRHGNDGTRLLRLEVNLHAQTAGVAILGLYWWLLRLHRHVSQPGSSPLPLVLAVVTDSGRGAKEMANNVVKGAVSSLLAAWGAPFRSAADSAANCRTFEAPGLALEDWLRSPSFLSELPIFFPCHGYLLDSRDGTLRTAHSMTDATESRCSEAFAAVKRFEHTHALNLQAMGVAYLEHRMETVSFALSLGEQLNLAQESVHDAVLLMDRVMSTGYTCSTDSMFSMIAACVKVTANRAVDPDSLLHDEDLEEAAGLPAGSLDLSEHELCRVLGNSTAAISGLRCVHVFLERMGCDFKDPASVEVMGGLPSMLATESLSDISFLNCRPSVIATGILYASRRCRGIVPYWPSVLAKMTGYRDLNTPELAVATKSAQRLYSKLLGQGAAHGMGMHRAPSESSFSSPLGGSPRGGSPVMWSSMNGPIGTSPPGSFMSSCSVADLSVASFASQPGSSLGVSVQRGGSMSSQGSVMSTITSQGSATPNIYLTPSSPRGISPSGSPPAGASPQTVHGHFESAGLDLHLSSLSLDSVGQ